MLHPFHYTPAQQLLPQYLRARLQFVQFLQIMQTKHPDFLNKIFFIDEATFTRRGGEFLIILSLKRIKYFKITFIALSTLRRWYNAVNNSFQITPEVKLKNKVRTSNLADLNPGFQRAMKNLYHDQSSIKIFKDTQYERTQNENENVFVETNTTGLKIAEFDLHLTFIQTCWGHMDTGFVIYDPKKHSGQLR
ncbi:hypothetical protein NQ318_014372 [Aromia moschata]|uniref:Transposase n=1 Tax=Aromia moschata TaxID=1265417 RepID=A0AAV8Z177_9CUCU|nr:hypothetical protein NQ318_014372 [Aromia moschata]